MRTLTRPCDELGDIYLYVKIQTQSIVNQSTPVHTISQTSRFARRAGAPRVVHVRSRSQSHQFSLR